MAATTTVASTEVQQQLDHAQEIADVKPDEAIATLQGIVENPAVVDEKLKETAIYQLATLFAKLGRPQDIAALLRKIRPFFAAIPKAKTAKIVRTLIDDVSLVPRSEALQVELCRESIEWARSEKRTFLRQRLETKLSSLYLVTREFTAALTLITGLLREVKRLDDKPLLVEIQLIESSIHYALRNIARSKAALTSARTAANQIYCPPVLQAEIDLAAGTLHAEEKDYKTAYSYFYEAFEGYSSLDSTHAIKALKYMLLCKIMTNHSDDVVTILSSNKLVALKYSGRDVDAMRAIANASKARSLSQFQESLAAFKDELQNDLIIKTHLQELYDNLLEQNLCRLIEPFSCVEIAHIAKLIALPVDQVERKLSQMILDKKFLGILDQGAGCLIVFEDPTPDHVYPAAVDVLGNLSGVVDGLFEKARRLQL